MPSPQSAAAAAAAAAGDGDGKQSGITANVESDQQETSALGSKVSCVPAQSSYSTGRTSRATVCTTRAATARGTTPEAAGRSSPLCVSSRKSFAARNRIVRFGSLSRTRHTLSSRQSLYKSFRFGSPWSGSRVAPGRLSDGGALVTAFGSVRQAAAAPDPGAGRGKNSLMFESRLVLRHAEYWTGKLSARRDAEAPPEVLCAQYSVLQQTLFIGLSTGVLLVWRNPFAAVPGQPEPPSFVMKAREHTGAISALTFHRKLEADRTPHHFQALQQLQGAQGFHSPHQNWETLPSWTTINAKQQQQQQTGIAASADHCMSAATAGPPAMLLQGKEAAVMRSEERTGVLFTGSADRCVKVWYIHEKRIECVKTLCFHGGTIVALAYCSPLLFSSSTDGTVLICRVDRATSTLKHPQFTPVQRIFTHQSYHPSTKLVLSNKKVWYDALAATRKDGDTIYLYCGATDGSVLALDNSPVLVPSNPIIGGGGAPPLNLRTQERAVSAAASQRKAHTHNDGNNYDASSNHGGAGRHSTSAVCDPAKWKDLLGSNSHSEGNNDSNDRQAPLVTDQTKKSSLSTASALTPSMEGLSGGGVLPVPFRILKKLHVHSLGVRHLLCLPLDSVVATLGSEASVAVIDPLTAQVWWQNENPEGCCYSASTWMPAFNLLLVGDDGGNLSFYNVYSRERVYSQQVTTNKIVTLGPGRNSTQVLACTAHEFILIDIVEAANEVQLEGHIGAVTNLYLQETTEGAYLYSTGDDHSIRVWDPARGLCCRVVRHKYADITSWLFLETLGGFVTGHEDGDIRFWTVKEFSSFSIRNTKGHRLHTNSVASMCCWPVPEIRRGEKMMSRQPRQGKVSDSIGGDAGDEKSNDQEAFQTLSCGYDGRLNIFELRIDRDTGEISAKLVDQLTGGGSNPEEILCCVAFHNVNAFFTAGNSPTITKWSMKTLTADEELDGHQLSWSQDAITALCKSASYLLSGSADRTVRVWTVEPSQCIHEIKHQGDPAACLISFERSSEAFWASMTWTGDISVWDSTWRLTASRKFQTAINCFACSESLRHLFIGTDKGMILTTPLPSRQKLTVIEKGRVTVGGVSFQEIEEGKSPQPEKSDCGASLK